jgi:predicted nucleic acid-binding protein
VEEEGLERTIEDYRGGERKDGQKKVPVPVCAGGKEGFILFFLYLCSSVRKILLMTERIYVDTSVFGGYFETEFEEWTKPFIEKFVSGEFKLLYSQLTEIELAKAPKRVQDLIQLIPAEHIEFLSITDVAISLADHYIKENVVGKTSIEDCRNIAIATLSNADILASWNFKHIVNVSRIRGYNSVNYKLGHKIIDIRTPREIIS